MFITFFIPVQTHHHHHYNSFSWGFRSRVIMTSPTLSMCNQTKAVLSKTIISSTQPECPPLHPSPDHLCAAPAGTLDCHYEFLTINNGGTVNCCCGQCDIDMTCAPDSITGSGLWQPMYSTLCPEDGCGSEGE